MKIKELFEKVEKLNELSEELLGTKYFVIVNCNDLSHSVGYRAKTYDELIETIDNEFVESVVVAIKNVELQEVKLLSGKAWANEKLIDHEISLEIVKEA